jgi:F-type H+-transporting ATPase subunit delta
MSSRASAFQYAKGLFSAAADTADPQPVGEELKGFAALVAGQPDLLRALTIAVVPTDRKQTIVRDLLALSPVSPIVRQFLLLLARHDRLSLLPGIVETYEARLMRRLGIETAEVTSAIPLSEAIRAEIAKILSAATGKDVRVSTRVDASIVGGVVARVGSLVFDGSVRRALDRIREQMVEGA